MKMKCENCLYRKNCQFLGKHKKVDVADCTAFVSETEVIKKAKSEAIREFARRSIEEIDAINYKEYNNYLDTLDIIERVAEEMECGDNGRENS